MTAGPTTVLLLADKRAGTDPVATAAGVPLKALATVAGRPMIALVLDAIAGIADVKRIVLVASDETALRRVDAVERARASGILEFAPAAASPSRSILAILDRGDIDTPILVATADAPLLTPEIIRHFWDSVPDRADIAAAVAPGAAVRARFPESRRTFLKFRDGDYCGCNLFALKTPRARSVVEFWRQLEDHRKRPLRMAASLGILAIIRFLTRTLTLDGAARHISRRTGAAAAIVELAYPEASVDVDKPGDLATVERVLAERAAGGPRP